MRPALYAAGISVALGGRTIVDGIDLTVAAGAWTTIIGPNGAGKSTILRALAGLVPASGRIDVHGVDRFTLTAKQVVRQLAFVAQQSAVPPGMRVDHYVLLGRTPHLAPLASESRRDLAIAAAALDALDLADFADRRLGTLSGGERQRVMLARALAQEPSVLLLDEPTTALDVGHQQDVLELVDRLRHERGLTVVSTMHDLTLAAQFGDHLLLVAGGRIVASGPPVQVLTGTEVARHYRAHVDVIRHRGSLVVVPVRSTTDQEVPDART